MTKYIQKFGMGIYNSENQPGIEKKMTHFSEQLEHGVIDINKFIQDKM